MVQIIKDKMKRLSNDGHGIPATFTSLLQVQQPRVDFFGCTWYVFFLSISPKYYFNILTCGKKFCGKKSLTCDQNKPRMQLQSLSFLCCRLVRSCRAHKHTTQTVLSCTCLQCMLSARWEGYVQLLNMQYP